MDAYSFDRYGWTVFALGPVPEDLHRLAIDRFGARVQRGVAFQTPGLDFHNWPEGADRPDCVVAVSQDDPATYRAFKYTSRVPAGFRSLGPNFNVVDEGGMRVWLESLGELDDIASHTDESDTPELWDQVMHSLNRD